MPIKQIVRRTGLSRGTVRQIVRGCRSDVFRVRQSWLEAYLPLLDALWEGGCRNGAALWRQLREKGFHGSLRVVGEASTRRRRAEEASDKRLQRVPSARTIAHMMTVGRDHLTNADAIAIAEIETGLPTLVEARQSIERGSLILSFAKGIAKGGPRRDHDVMVQRPDRRSGDAT